MLETLILMIYALTNVTLSMILFFIIFSLSFHLYTLLKIEGERENIETYIVLIQVRVQIRVLYQIQYRTL